MNLYDRLKDPLALAVFVATLMLPVLVGFLAMRRTRNQADFFVGGRAMGRLAVALSAVASGRSSWLVLGVSGIAYLRGVSAVWAVTGYILVELLQFFTLGRRLREESGKNDCLTIVDYYHCRFQDRGLLRITAALIIGVFLTAYVAAQFNAGAKALGTALDQPFPVALLAVALLTMGYMVAGGYIAVVYNDVIRAFIMIFGLLVFPVYGLVKAGGLEAVLTTLQALNPALVDPFSLSWGAFLGFVGIGLGSPGQPHIMVRFMSIADPERLRAAALIGTTWNVAMAWGAVFIGLLGRSLFTAPADLPGGDPEMVYLVVSSLHFSPLFYGIMVGGIFAAILSTADSQLLVVASTFVRDVYEKIICRKKGRTISEKKKLVLSRRLVVLCGVLSMLLAYLAADTIFWLVLFAWGGLGASFGSTLILSLYWKGMTALGAWAGMVSGTLITVVWKLWLQKTSGVYELLPAFFGALLIAALVSRLIPGNTGSQIKKIGDKHEGNEKRSD